MAKKTYFTEQETEILNNLVDKYRPIITSKITNAYFNKKKEDTWRKLTIEFNAISCMKQRTTLQLQNRYKNLKKLARRNEAANQNSCFETEEGTSSLETIPLGKELVAIGVVKEEIENDWDCHTEYNEYIEEKPGINSTEEKSGEYLVSDISYNVEQKPKVFIGEIHMTEPETPIHKEVRAASIPPRESEITEVASPGPSLRIEEVVSNGSCNKTPLKKFFNTSRHRPNASQKAAEAMVARVKARQSAIEEALLLKEEHLLKMEREAEKHAIEMEIQRAKLRNEEQMLKVLIAKEAYYKRLNHIED